MASIIYVSLAEAVAADVEGYRSGARHPLMIFSKAAAYEEAETLAAETAQDCGWTEVTITKTGKLDWSSELASDVASSHRQAKLSALKDGCSIVVYKEEVRPDS